MPESQTIELITIERRTITDEREIDAWINRYPITKNAEATLVYFLEHMLVLGNEAGFFVENETSRKRRTSKGFGGDVNVF